MFKNRTKARAKLEQRITRLSRPDRNMNVERLPPPIWQAFLEENRVGRVPTPHQPIVELDMSDDGGVDPEVWDDIVRATLTTWLSRYFEPCACAGGQPGARCAKHVEFLWRKRFKEDLVTLLVRSEPWLAKADRLRLRDMMVTVLEARGYFTLLANTSSSKARVNFPDGTCHRVTGVALGINRRVGHGYSLPELDPATAGHASGSADESAPDSHAAPADSKVATKRAAGGGGGAAAAKPRVAPHAPAGGVRLDGPSAAMSSTSSPAYNNETNGVDEAAFDASLGLNRRACAASASSSAALPAPAAAPTPRLPDLDDADDAYMEMGLGIGSVPSRLRSDTLDAADLLEAIDADDEEEGAPYVSRLGNIDSADSAAFDAFDAADGDGDGGDDVNTDGGPVIAYKVSEKMRVRPKGMKRPAPPPAAVPAPLAPPAKRTATETAIAAAAYAAAAAAAATLATVPPPCGASGDVDADASAADGGASMLAAGACLPCASAAPSELLCAPHAAPASMVSPQVQTSDASDDAPPQPATPEKTDTAADDVHEPASGGGFFRALSMDGSGLAPLGRLHSEALSACDVLIQPLNEPRAGDGPSHHRPNQMTTQPLATDWQTADALPALSASASASSSASASAGAGASGLRTEDDPFEGGRPSDEPMPEYLDDIDALLHPRPSSTRGKMPVTAVKVPVRKRPNAELPNRHARMRRSAREIEEDGHAPNVKPPPAVGFEWKTVESFEPGKPKALRKAAAKKGPKVGKLTPGLVPVAADAAAAE